MWWFLETKIVKELESIKVLCVQCKGWETLRIREDYTTRKCNCGVTIYYPPKKGMDFGIKRFVSKEEYLYNKNALKGIIKKDLEQRGIVVKDATRKNIPEPPASG